MERLKGSAYKPMRDEIKGVIIRRKDKKGREKTQE